MKRIQIFKVSPQEGILVALSSTGSETRDDTHAYSLCHTMRHSMLPEVSARKLSLDSFLDLVPPEL